MATFHYCLGTPSNSVFSDIQALNKFTSEQFTSITDIIITYLSDPAKSNKLLEQLDEFASQSGIGSSALRNVVKTFLSIPNGAMKKNLGPTHLQEDLTNLGLSETHTQHFIDQWKASQVMISQSALSQTLVINQLVDMDWKFGVTAASSEVDKLGNTFLQLKLVIKTGSGLRNVYMELTLPQFYSFLHEMEKAKASLTYFS